MVIMDAPGVPGQVTFNCYDDRIDMDDPGASGQFTFEYYYGKIDFFEFESSKRGTMYDFLIN